MLVAMVTRHFDVNAVPGAGVTVASGRQPGSDGLGRGVSLSGPSSNLLMDNIVYIHGERNRCSASQWNLQAKKECTRLLYSDVALYIRV